VPAVDPVVAPQPLKEPPKVTVGDAGMCDENAAGNVTVKVFAAASDPLLDAVKVSVHVVVLP
jgi:hypothetical protein